MEGPYNRLNLLRDAELYGKTVQYTYNVLGDADLSSSGAVARQRQGIARFIIINIIVLIGAFISIPPRWPCG